MCIIVLFSIFLNCELHYDGLIVDCKLTGSSAGSRAGSAGDASAATEQALSV